MCKIINYKINPIPNADFLTIFKNYSKQKYASFFSCEDFLLIAFNCVKVFRVFEENSEITSFNKKQQINQNPWQVVNDFVNENNFEDLPYPINKIGAIGYVSYEMLHFIEKIKASKSKNLKIPFARLAIYNNYIFYDKANQKTFEIVVNWNTKPLNQSILQKLNTSYKVKNLTSCTTEENYINKVNSIKQSIVNGRIYEVNLTRQLSADFEGSSFALFEKLYAENPSNYSAYFIEDDFEIVCNSPEMFIKFENQTAITKPIKGTTPRFDDKLKDNQSKNQLLNSKKDEAELYMIVDLLRNDLAKVACAKGVEVINPKNLIAVKNVWHLEGIIKAKIKPGISSIDLLKSAFPGGSITGCPKVESMQVIAELEEYARMLYTGSIFVANKKYLQSNIVIRTAVIKNNKIYLNAGGAVTIDSDAKNEYDETTHKLSSFLKVFS